MAKTVSCCCNILWFIFGGFFSFISWIMAGLIFCISIIGIPFGLQAFKIASFVICPFGKDVVQSNKSIGCCKCCGNIIWIIICGFFIACFNVVCGLICFISIIGIPFGFQFFKIAKLALTPFGYEIVDEDELNNRIIETTPIIIKNNNNNINNFNIQTNQNFVNQTNQNFVNQTNQNFVNQTNQNFVTQTNQNFVTQNY